VFLLKAQSGQYLAENALSVVVAFASRINTRYVPLAHESALAAPAQ
jgi:hypothetical protein